MNLQPIPFNSSLIDTSYSQVLLYFGNKFLFKVKN